MTRTSVRRRCVRRPRGSLSEVYGFNRKRGRRCSRAACDSGWHFGLRVRSDVGSAGHTRTSVVGHDGRAPTRRTRQGHDRGRPRLGYTRRRACSRRAGGRSARRARRGLGRGP